MPHLLSSTTSSRSPPEDRRHIEMRVAGTVMMIFV
jgi:hypothetical protein